jgi:hypothetical protein
MSEIFSEKVVTSRRTYFFDVKETKEGARYLVIGELTQVGSELERHRVMVFEENIDNFVDGLNKAADFIRYGEVSPSPPPERRAREYGGAGEGPSTGEIGQALERIERKLNEIRQHFK